MIKWINCVWVSVWNVGALKGAKRSFPWGQKLKEIGGPLKKKRKLGDKR